MHSEKSCCSNEVQKQMNGQPVTNVIMKGLVKSYSFIDVGTIRNLEESISPNIFCGVNAALQCVKIAVITPEPLFVLPTSHLKLWRSAGQTKKVIQPGIMYSVIKGLTMYDLASLRKHH